MIYCSFLSTINRIFVAGWVWLQKSGDVWFVVTSPVIIQSGFIIISTTGEHIWIAPLACGAGFAKDIVGIPFNYITIDILKDIYKDLSYPKASNEEV